MTGRCTAPSSKDRGSAQFSRYIRTYLAGHIQLGDLPTPGLPPEVLANYVAGAELALVTWWLESDMPYTPEHMAELTQRLTLGIVGVVDPTVLRNIVPSSSLIRPRLIAQRDHVMSDPGSPCVRRRRPDAGDAPET
ncbi:MAG: TetR-like C-terminal domain-containing protein [Anaerolineae bacterium]